MYIMPGSTAPFDPLEVLRELQVPVLVLESDGQALFTNRSFETLFGEAGLLEVIRVVRAAGLRAGTFAVSGLFDARTFEVDVRLWSGGRDQAERLLLVTAAETADRVSAEAEIHACNRRLEIINRIIRAGASSMTLDEILEVVIRQTVELMGFDAGAVYLVDRCRERADLRAFYGMYDLYFPDVLTIDICRSRYREVFVEKNACYTEKYCNVDHETGELGVFSLASIPITSRSGVIGSINIASSSFHRFTRLEKSILEAIGEEIGGVIARAVLAEDLESAHWEANFYLDLMVHDINNANTIALGYLCVLEDRLDGSFGEEFRRVKSGLLTSSGIISGVSRLRSLGAPVQAPGTVNLDAAIRNAIRLFPDAKILYAGTGVEVRADDLVTEIFANIVGNAVKFGGPGVEIAVSVEERGGDVLVTVADTGPGIPDALKETVFHRLERGGAREAGLGLGLYISRKLVERYGGKIWMEDGVASSPGAGTAVKILLPAGPG